MSKIPAQAPQAPQAPRPASTTEEPNAGNQKSFNRLYTACRSTLSGDSKRPLGPALFAAGEPPNRNGSTRDLQDAFSEDPLPFGDAGLEQSGALSFFESGSTQGWAGQDQGSGLPGAMSFAQEVNESSDDSLDYLALASLLPEGADDGIFEVTLPNSATMGVVVTDQPSVLSYLLIPDSGQLASRLRGHEMELEGYLKRRIRRNVKVAVL